MNTTDSWWRPVTALGGGRALAALVGFLAVGICADALGPDELGRWSVLLAIHAHALHLTELGLRSVVTAEAGYAGGGYAALLARYLGLRFAACAFAGLVALSATAIIAPDMLVATAMVTSTLFAIALQLDWLALAGGRPFEAGALLIVRPAVMLALLLAVPGVSTASDLAAIFAIAWWSAAAVSWITLRRDRELPVSPMPADRLLRLGLPLMLVTLTSQAQLGLDILIIGTLFGSTDAGHYFLAAAIVGAGLVAANAIGQLATARMASLRDREGEFRSALLRELRAAGLLALLGACALATLAPLAIPWVFGARYEPTATLVIWLLPWLVLQSLSTVAQGALTAVRRQPDLLRANIGLVLSLAILLPLAVWLDALAAFAVVRAVAESVRLFLLLEPFARGFATTLFHRSINRECSPASHHTHARRSE